MSNIIKSGESVLEDYRINLYHVNDTAETEETSDSSNEEEYRKKYELISKEKKQILEHARIQAKQTASKILEDAYAQRDKIVNTAETEAARLKQLAKEEGFSEGMKDSEVFLRDSLTGLNEEFARLKREEQAAFERLNEDVIQIAFNMAEKILKKELERDEMALLSLVKSVLKEEADKNNITVHLSSKAYRLAEELKKHLNTAREQGKNAVKIKKDDIGYSDLKIETEDGIVDASISVQLENLKKFISEYRED